MPIGRAVRAALISAVLAAASLASVAAAEVASAAPGTPPGPVHDALAFDTGHGVRLSWTNPTTPFAGVAVRYAEGGKAPADPASGTAVALASPTAHSARLPDLTPGARYSVALWTYDMSEQYSGRSILRFTTLPAPEAAATVSGTVTDRKGHALANVHVYTETFGATEQAGTTTDDAGHYVLTIPPGNYYIGFDGALATGGNSDASGYQGDFATVEALAGGETRSGVDAKLDPGAAITGRVTDAAGNPLAGVVPTATPAQPYVNVTDSAFAVFEYFGPTATRPSAADGSFAIKGLPASAVQVCLDPTAGGVTGGGSDRLGYAGRCTNRVTITRTGRPVRVSDVPLAGNSGGVLTGVVTDQSGAPVADAFVYAQSIEPDAGYADSGTAITAADGSYRIAVPAGRYSVCADPGSGAPGKVGGTAICAAEPVHVRSGQLASADLRLGPAGAAAGRILGPGGAPAAFAAVSIEPVHQRSGTYSGTTTDASGYFRVTGLAPGDYRACAYAFASASDTQPTGLAPKCTDRNSPLPVRVGITTLGFDATLSVGGAISGVVSDDLGAPLTDVLVEADQLLGRLGNIGFEGDAFVAPDGSYTITGLPAGTYLVCPLWLPGNGSSFALSGFGEPCAHPSRVNVTAGATTTGVKLVVATGGSLDVTIRNSRHQPIAGVNVAALRPCPHPFRDNCTQIPLFGAHRWTGVAASAVTGPDGTATLTGLRPGNYALCAFAYYGATAKSDSPTGYADSCGSATFDVGVNDHATTTVTRELSEAGAVTGTVTDSEGNPLSGAAVSVSHAATSDYVDPQEYFPSDGFGPAADVITDADGHFTIHGVQPGEQTVCVDAQRASGGVSTTGYLDACFGGDRLSTAAPVDVQAGQSSQVLITLPTAVAISGRITTADGRFPRFAAALILRSLRQGSFVAVDATGRYRAEGLAPGTYRVCFLSLRYRAQCYHAVPWNGRGPLPSAAVHIVLAAGEERKHVDAVLHR